MGAVTYPDPLVTGELDSWLRRSVDIDEEPLIADTFGISTIPTAVAIDADGRVLATIKGYRSPESFTAMLAEARQALDTAPGGDSP